MFHVGQLVVCVDDRNFGIPCDPHPLHGSVYTIRDCLCDRWGNTYVRLQEIRAPVLVDYGRGEEEGAYLVWRFRPVEETRLAIFRKMLAPAPRKEEVA